jgi:predicted transcriptional regulator
MRSIELEMDSVMPRNRPPRPTEAELEILSVLWEHGPTTVRAVYDLLSPARSIGYTTVLKLMQNMTEKGLVVRDESQRSHVYSAAYREEQTQQQLVADLLNRAFAGATDKLILQALRTKKVTPEELNEVRRLLDELEEKS